MNRREQKEVRYDSTRFWFSPKKGDKKIKKCFAWKMTILQPTGVVWFGFYMQEKIFDGLRWRKTDLKLPLRFEK